MASLRSAFAFICIDDLFVQCQEIIFRFTFFSTETQLSSEIQDNDQENQPDLTETSPESSQVRLV